MAQERVYVRFPLIALPGVSLVPVKIFTIKKLPHCSINLSMCISADLFFYPFIPDSRRDVIYLRTPYEFKRTIGAAVCRGVGGTLPRVYSDEEHLRIKSLMYVSFFLV